MSDQEPGERKRARSRGALSQADREADREPLSQRVAAALREAILDGRLPAGHHMRQEELAEQYGTSRIPVREALRALESEGLVTIVPHVGARVARLDFAEYSELYLLREAVEPMVLAHSVPNLEEETIDQLRDLADQVARAEDPRIWLDLDRRFHLLCYEGADMPRALQMIEGFWNTTQQYRRVYLQTLDRERLKLVDADHDLIIDAIRRRDAEDASERLRLHIRRTRRTLAERPELFDSAPESKEGAPAEAVDGSASGLRQQGGSSDERGGVN